MEEEANKSSNASTSDSKFTSKKTRNAAGGKSKAKSSKIQISGVKSESRATGSSEASASYDCSLEVSSKRDRELMPEDLDVQMSADSSSDENKKMTKEQEEQNGMNSGSTGGKKRNGNVQKNKSKKTIVKESTNNSVNLGKNNGSSSSSSSSNTADSDIPNQINHNNEKMEVDSDGAEIAKASCSACNSSKKSSSSKGNNSNNSTDGERRSTSRSRSRNYRSRFEESSEEEETMETQSTGARSEDSRENRRRSSNRERRRSSTDRRAAGELRDSTRQSRAERNAGSSRGQQPSRSERLAQFLATDSDDSESANLQPSRSHRSSRRSSTAPAAEENVAAVAEDGAVAGSDNAPDEDAQAADESVASRVLRRRTSRRSSQQGGAEEEEGGESEVQVRRYPRHRSHNRFSSSSSNSSSPSLSLSGSDDGNEAPSRNRDRRRRRPMQEEMEADIKADALTIKEKKLPKHNFHLTKELISRQYTGGLCSGRVPAACGSRYGLHFSQNFYSSLHAVERLELVAKLNHHQGCVNAVGFSNSGSVLVSGSDDLQIALWDWNREKLLLNFQSGHRNNVFQCKFLPLLDDRHIVTCARDGQVRLAEVADGVCRSTKRLAKHNGPCHKLATSNARPQVVLSAGEDGEIKESDLRQERAKTIAITTDDRGDRVALHSIHNHPLNENQFCVAGRDQYVCVYDRRITTITAPPVLKYCPDHIVSARPRYPRTSITCAVYSNTGDAIVATYSDEDIYLFDTKQACQAPPIHKYSGHRNSATVKGVNMFGPRSEFIISGSDCGNIFIWSRETEAIVRCFPGDENGVVNVLEGHPHLPLLATSGLDNDVKIWLPSCEKMPKDEKLADTVEANLRERRLSSGDVVDLTDNRMIMMIWHHMNRMQNRRRQDGGREGADPIPRHPFLEDDSSENNDDDDDDDDALEGGGARNLGCAPQ